jgi:predicted transcriptional regulator
MDTAPRPDDSAAPSPAETAEEAKRRFAWEAARIAEADASLAAGLFVDAAEVDAWIDSIGTDHELPVPYSGR